MPQALAPSPVQRGRSWQLEEALNNRWRAIVPRGVTIDDLIESRVWEAVAPDLRPFDRITAISEDGAFWADLLIVNATPGALGVRVLWHEMLPRSGARG
jgi:hypothetical protein